MDKGRPSDYSEDKAKEILELIALGNSMRKVCEMEGMPAMSTVWRWLFEHEDFRKHYERATEERTDAQNELLLEMGDQAIAHAESTDPKVSNAIVSAYKLKADNLKWVMSKMKPKKYGDKVDLTTAGKELPTPILRLDVLRNHSDHKDSSDEEKDSGDTGWDISK